MGRRSQETLNSPEYDLLVSLLKDACKQSGLAPVEISARLGKPRQFIHKITHQERRLDVLELVKLCEAIGVNPVEFMMTFMEKRAGLKGS